MGTSRPPSAHTLAPTPHILSFKANVKGAREGVFGKADTFIDVGIRGR